MTVEELFQMLIDTKISHDQRLSAYQLILNVADNRSDNDFVKANLLLGHLYAGFYGNPIPNSCPIPNGSLAECRYINVCSKHPENLEAEIALAHLYCRNIFNAHLVNNSRNIEIYHTKLFNHIHNIKNFNALLYGKNYFETLHNVLTSKSCDSLKLSQDKCNLIWLLTVKYYLAANHLDYEMAKRCLVQFNPVTDDSRHSESMINILEEIGFYESRLSEHLGRHVQNICGNFIKIILSSNKLIAKAQSFQNENKIELAYWYVELAATALENNFYKNTADALDKRNEIIKKCKAICALFPEIQNIKHILKHMLGLKTIEQLHELLIIEYPESLPLRKAILSESTACYIKSDHRKQDKIIALIYKDLINLKSLFPGKNPVDIFSEMSIDIHKYHAQPIQNDIYLIWLALAKHLLQKGAAYYGDVFKCFKRCLEMENIDYNKILATLEQCKRSLMQQYHDEFVHLLVQIALKAYDPATGKNLDIKYQVINTILELKTTDELLALSEKCTESINGKEKSWYAETAVRGLSRIKVYKNNKHRLNILQQIATIAKNYPDSAYMRERLDWARSAISNMAMIAKAASMKEKTPKNKDLHNEPNDACAVKEQSTSTLKIALR